jgi:hypothetical protein
VPRGGQFSRAVDNDDARRRHVWFQMMGDDDCVVDLSSRRLSREEFPFSGSRPTNTAPEFPPMACDVRK